MYCSHSHFQRSFFSSVQSLNHVRIFVTQWTTTHQTSLSVTNFQNLLKLKSIELVMPSNHFILCHPLLLPPSIFPGILTKESVLRITWPKYWSFSFSISPSDSYSGNISLQWTGWISLQSKGLSRVFSNTIVQKHQLHSDFFIVQLSHPYMTTGKTIALTRWTFVSKVMSLDFNMISTLVITFLPRGKCFLISWL